MPGAIREGSEFRVNTTTAGIQYDPIMQPLPDGRVVIVWSDTSNGTDVDLRARIITPDGRESVAEFVVTATTGDHQYEPAIAVLADGSFVVVWSDTSNGSDVDVRARVFHADGSEAVGEFVVSSGVAADQFNPTVTTLADGRFVVAWADNSGANADIRARIFNADGSQSVAEFVVNGTTAGSQYDPVAVALADGRFVVSWTDHSRSGGDASELAIRAGVFNGDGSQAVPEFLVNTTTAGSQLEASAIVLADGRVVFAWSDYSGQSPDQSGGAVRARIFNTDFTPAADDFVVNGTTLSYQAQPAMAALADGGFVVTWTDLSQSAGDTSFLAARGQQFDAAGVRAGREFVANTTTASAQFGPAIVALGNGRIVVTWTDFSQTAGDTSGSAVRGQIFDINEYAPVIVSNGGGNGATVAVAENTAAVTTVTSSDPNGEPPSYTIAGGDDAALFQIDAVSGTLSFIAAPDFEHPADADRDNSYVVAVRTSDGAGLFDEQTLAVVVTDVGGRTVSGDAGDNRLVGTVEPDTILGRGGSDRLIGGGGPDNLNGGSGRDTVEYLGEQAVTVDLAAGTALTASGTDTLISIEQVIGSPFADTIRGNGLDNLLAGAAGNDRLEGFGGNDRLEGGGGEDILIGGPGNDALLGQAGIDRADYSSTGGTGVVVDLRSGTATGGAGNDTLSGIENVWGSNYRDTLNGNEGANELCGFAGNDVINGYDGNDRLEGMDGNDTMTGGRGSDLLFGGDGNDRLYGGAGVDMLSGGPGNDLFYYVNPGSGQMNGDTITDFERVAGQNTGDSLVIHAGFSSIVFNDGSTTITYGGVSETILHPGVTLSLADDLLVV